MDGSVCAETKKPRTSKITYFCDNYQSKDELKIIDIMEPSFCNYAIRVTTKYMCSKMKTLPKASTRL